MRFNEFKEQIESIFAEKFPDSECRCGVIDLLGKAIEIDCYLAKDEGECRHSIKRNDIMKVMFISNLPSDWMENMDLPENLRVDAIERKITTKPDEEYYYCSYRKIPYRRQDGVEKFIKSFYKFIGNLYAAIEEEYGKDNLLDYDKKLIESKHYFN